MNPVSSWLNELSKYVCSKQYCQTCKYVGRYHTHAPSGQRNYPGTVQINGGIGFTTQTLNVTGNSNLIFDTTTGTNVFNVATLS